MQGRSEFHVGLDVHKDSITIAVADPGREKARLISKVAHDVPKLLKVLAKIGAVDDLHIVYEAAFDVEIGERAVPEDVVLPASGQLGPAGEISAFVKRSHGLNGSAGELR